jgi:ankyrin repeat protein
MLSSSTPTNTLASLLAGTHADVNQPNGNGITPFFIACQNGHAAIVTKLLANERVKVNKATNNGLTPFYAACKKGKTC